MNINEHESLTLRDQSEAPTRLTPRGITVNVHRVRASKEAKEPNATVAMVNININASMQIGEQPKKRFKR
jgi:hypothetical protein